MTETKEFTEEQKEQIMQIAALAKQSERSAEVNWNNMKISEDEAFIMMASNVIEQLNSVPDEHIEKVCMATMTKLLVENFALNLKIKDLENEQI